MSNKLVPRQKVTQVTRMIDHMIVLRTEQLVTFVRLKETINRRSRHGELFQSDIVAIKAQLKRMRKR